MLLEAMACGVPCVGSTRDATAEVLADGLGELADPDDPADLARAVRAALARPKGVPAGLARYDTARFRSRLTQILHAHVPGLAEA